MFTSPDSDLSTGKTSGIATQMPSRKSSRKSVGTSSMSALRETTSEAILGIIEDGGDSDVEEGDDQGEAKDGLEAKNALEVETDFNTDLIGDDGEISPPAKVEERYGTFYVPVSLQFSQIFHESGTAMSRSMLPFSQQGGEMIEMDYESRALLYPRALSMILRLVRALANVRSNVMLFGFPGSSREKAMKIAAKLCGFILRTFDVKETFGSPMELSASIRAQMVTSFRRYLKNCILHAAGFYVTTRMDQSANDAAGAVGEKGLGGGAVGTSSTIIGASDSISIVEPERMLLFITGAQELQASDRLTLLYLMDSGNPMMMFEENEIQILVEAIRRAALAEEMDFVEALTDKAEEHERKRIEAMQTPSSGKSSAFAGSPRAQHSGIWSPVGNAVAKSAVHEGENEAAAETRNIQYGLGGNAAQRARDAVPGYMFQWVKKLLQMAIQQKIVFAMSADLPRTMLLEASPLHLKGAKPQRNDDEDDLDFDEGEERSSIQQAKDDGKLNSKGNKSVGRMRLSLLAHPRERKNKDE